jgi:hypothetical protein
MPASQTDELKKSLAQAVGRARIQKQASQAARSSADQQSVQTEEAQNQMVVALVEEIHRYLRAVDSINETPAQAALQEKFVVLYRECTYYRSMFAKVTFKLDENAANMSGILQARPMHNIITWKDWEKYANEHTNCRGAGPLLEAVDWWKSVGTALEKNTAEFRALRDIMTQLSNNFDRQRKMFTDLQSDITVSRSCLFLLACSSMKRHETNSSKPI